MNSPSASDIAPLASLPEIRERHIELMRQTLHANSMADLASVIIEFMQRVAQAGVHIEGDDQRAIAQGVLDYWNATLFTSGARDAAAKTPAKLKSFVHNLGIDQEPSKNPFRDLRSLGVDDQSRFLAGMRLSRRWLTAY